MPHDCCFIRYQDHLLGCTTCIVVENLSKKATKLTHIFLCYREKPGDPEWEVLEDQKQPFLLNFSQCKLCLKDYYPVIEHTTTVLKRDKGNTFHLYIVWFTFCLTFDENSFDNPTVVSCVSTGPGDTANLSWGTFHIHTSIFHMTVIFGTIWSEVCWCTIKPTYTNKQNLSGTRLVCL